MKTAKEYYEDTIVSLGINDINFYERRIEEAVKQGNFMVKLSREIPIDIIQHFRNLGFEVLTQNQFSMKGTLGSVGAEVFPIYNIIYWGE
jgi:hypothetical protein